MSIYKLSDIIGFTRGGTPFQKKDLLNQGKFMALHYGKTYQKNIINNDFKYFVNDEFFKEKQLTEKGDTILITTSETVKELGKPVYYNANKQGLLGGEQIKIFPKDPNILLKKYLFLYFSKHWRKIQRFQTGIKVFRVKGDDLKYMEGFFPCIKIQKQIIDIIEPIENAINKIEHLKNKLLKYISNLKTQENTFCLSKCSDLVKFAPKGIKQVSAKVMNKRDSFIHGWEGVNTYKTNTFFCGKNTLLINTIRTYLEKFTILPIDADCNGTLAHIWVKNKQTSILYNLMNNDFWEQAQKFSKGTKMPTLNKKDLMNEIQMKEVETEIPNIFELLSTLNQLSIMLKKTKNKTIRFLIK